MKTLTIAAATRRNEPDGVKAALGHQLGERRRLLGVSIEQLLVMSGLRRWQLFRVEQGCRPIPRQWYDDAAIALDQPELARAGRAGA